MAYAIDILRREHANMQRLLGLLEHQITLVETAQQPDYELIKSISDYFDDFPRSCHHPKEDVIFDKLKERNPDAAEAMGDLEHEHGAVAIRLADLSHAIDNVLLDIEVSRDQLVMVARRFLEDERKHMMMEERYFFPVALDSLEDEDWSEIEARLTKRADPLFDSIVEDKFRTLRQELLEWGKEAS
ncbi:MAG: hemerythrin domain-containing protein [Hyphomicrobiales bacterium]